MATEWITDEQLVEWTRLSIDVGLAAEPRSAIFELIEEVRKLRSLLPEVGHVLLHVPYRKVSKLTGDVLVELDTDFDQSHEVWLESYQVAAMGKPIETDE